MERIDPKFTVDDLVSIAKMVRTGKSKFLWSESNTRKWHRVTYKGSTFIVVYDKTRLAVATTLENDAMEHRATHPRFVGRFENVSERKQSVPEQE